MREPRLSLPSSYVGSATFWSIEPKIHESMRTGAASFEM